MPARLSKLWDTLRASYWFVPSLMTGLAVVLWATLGALDAGLQRLGIERLPWLYRDSLTAARTLLLAVAGATIGLIGVVFSITMVPLTIAASQLGPRLLRTFLRDTGTQVVLGTFVATFVYCMLVLLQLHDDTVELPQLLITAALYMALATLGVLIYFIDHVAVSIQAPRVVAAVVAELEDDIARSFPEPLDPDALPPEPAPSLPGEPPQLVLATRSGYVQARDDKALLGLAVAHDLFLRLLAEPGSFVVAGTPLVQAWPAGRSTKLAAAVNSAHILGPQRTLVQDIEFGINELVEVAVRALSPAINDPFTAMTCIDWLGHTLCRLCERRLVSPYRRDEEGNPRLMSTPLTFDRLLDAAFHQIRQYGRGSAAVSGRLLDALELVGGHARTEEQRRALLRHVGLVAESAEGGLAEPTARDTLARRAREVAQAITGERLREIGAQSLV
jgi:uncharacterized membrane protein